MPAGVYARGVVIEKFSNPNPSGSGKFELSDRDLVRSRVTVKGKGNDLDLVFRTRYRRPCWCWNRWYRSRGKGKTCDCDVGGPGTGTVIVNGRGTWRDWICYCNYPAWPSPWPWSFGVEVLTRQGLGAKRPRVKVKRAGRSPLPKPWPYTIGWGELSGDGEAGVRMEVSERNDVGWPGGYVSRLADRKMLGMAGAQKEDCFGTGRRTVQNSKWNGEKGFRSHFGPELN